LKEHKIGEGGGLVVVRDYFYTLYRINNYIMVALSSIELVGTALYKRFQEEREHILRNKWYMSEREGKDVGFEKALLDWVFRHRASWLNKK